MSGEQDLFPLRQVQASAYRCRRFPANVASRMRMQNCVNLHGDVLPVPPPATASAAAPRKQRMAPAPDIGRDHAPQPDPANEQRLETLAAAVLGKHEKQAPLDAAQPFAELAAAPTPAAPPGALSPEVAPDIWADRTDRTGRRMAPEASQSRQARRPPRPRAGPVRAISAALLAGLIVGLGSAWWLMQLGDLGEAASANISANISASVSAQHLPPTSAALNRASEDISKSPTPGPDQIERADAHALPAQPSDSANANDGQSSAAEPTGNAIASTPDDAIEEVTEQVTEKSRPATQQAISTTKSGPEINTAQTVKRSVPKSKKIAAATPRKNDTAASSKRDQEIDRLKSQAYGESSRDRIRRGQQPLAPPLHSVSSQPMSRASIAGNNKARPTVSKAFARCEAISGLFSRESCKWKVCGERWGRDGCPSYATAAVDS